MTATQFLIVMVGLLVWAFMVGWGADLLVQRSKRRMASLERAGARRLRAAMREYEHVQGDWFRA